MDLALYHPELGYYARAAQRSGRAGDFFTSVDVGPIFGELLARQIVEMAAILGSPPHACDLVEAGAGNGRLSADILRAVEATDPLLLRQLRLHLVEASAAARAAQPGTLGEYASRLTSAGGELPERYEGVLIANELLDAMPAHQVVMHEDGLREVFVVEHGGRLTAREGAPSTPALGAYLEALGVDLEPGWRVEINLRARDWVSNAARRLTRGFLILIDYGHPAADLYSASHASGTLTTFRRHTSAPPEGADGLAWLACPGEQDITAHVDFTTVGRAAEAEGLARLGFMDQTYFLLGLLGPDGGRELAAAERRAVKTLIMPGGLGSTFKVMIFGKGVGSPALLGGSQGGRVT
jgi:SAM-dependent MidA family methyltransferase